MRRAGGKGQDVDVCEIVRVDARHVETASKGIPDGDTIHALAEIFRSLSDPTRVKIITALSRHELCVCELAEILGVSGSAVSHQLRLLRGQRLVKYRKKGKAAYYSLDDQHIRNLIAEGMRHVRGA
jgi:DNA-binding transcriptional ArsR family regulator